MWKWKMWKGWNLATLAARGLGKAPFTLRLGDLSQATAGTQYAVSADLGVERPKVLLLRIGRHANAELRGHQ